MSLPSQTPVSPETPTLPRRLLLRMAAAAGSVTAAVLAGCGFSGRPVARIYRGMLPPMLYAVGTLEVNLAGNGQVRSVRWMRGPTHAPEVMQEIEMMVRSAAPYPSPGGRGGRYVDTWLWDRSGRFQLDSLTEGQLRA